jgi:hypothetical protein
MSSTDYEKYPPLALAPEPSEHDASTSEPVSSPAGIRRPAKLIELDGVPLHKWRIEPDAVYLWKGRLWRKEPVGCVLCVEQEGNGYLTFASAERWPSAYFCMQHGELCEVGYEMKKRYEITIGNVVREGEERVNDTMLFPTEMTLGERTTLIERLLDEAQEEEAEAGPAPSE